MITINNYVRVKDLEEAYVLNQKRTNRIIGGMMWLRLSNGRVQTAIDLADLGLNQIEETEDAFYIGCMCSLRELELHRGMHEAFGGIIQESVRHIVGVQFRNQATIGGSIFGRFGFSDILTSLLILDTYVELYKGGVVPLKDFVDMERDNDILVRMIIKKDRRQAVYTTQRMTATDFPVVACAVSKTDDTYYIAVGARPMKACLVTSACPKRNGLAEEEHLVKEAKQIAKDTVERISFGSNLRAGAEYRKRIAEVLIKRAITAIGGGSQDAD